MFFSRQFEHFDPLHGSVPSQPFPSLPSIAARARYQLRRRSTDDVRAAAIHIDYAISEYYRRMRELDAERAESDWSIALPEMAEISASPARGSKIDPRYMEEEINDEVEGLIGCQQWWTNLGGPEFSDGEVQEWFAVVALWLLSDALAWLEKGHQDGSMSADERFASICNAGHSATRAMYASCYAERLEETKLLEQELRAFRCEIRTREAQREVAEKQRRSMLGEQLNVHRHAKVNRAKDLVVEEWAKSRARWPSAEKAGSYFADWVVEQRLLETIEPRTVSGWIRGYAKLTGIRLR